MVVLNTKLEQWWYSTEETRAMVVLNTGKTRAMVVLNTGKTRAMVVLNTGRNSSNGGTQHRAKLEQWWYSTEGTTEETRAMVVLNRMKHKEMTCATTKHHV